MKILGASISVASVHAPKHGLKLEGGGGGGGIFHLDKPYGKGTLSHLIFVL